MRALLSVSDKTGIIEFAKGLQECGVELISTGGTRNLLTENGIDSLAIDTVTGFPEMLDGRVKTLHPMIHGGLLARRDLPAHIDALKEHKIKQIDIVCVNLYPFKETIMKPDVTFADAIENIDIGGPSMIRSAAKNHSAVTVVTDISDYEEVLSELKEQQQTSLDTRKRLAAKAFRLTAAYDALIAQYLTEQVEETEPERLTFTYERKQDLRYGENSHQAASFYQTALPVGYSLAQAKQLHGKELSFNNLRDADAALRIAREFTAPTVVALKHMNPCGIGTAETIEGAWDLAFTADPVSIFGGIIVLNREVDQATAEKMHALFLEIIIAPSYTAEALSVLQKKKNVRLLELSFAEAKKANQPETTSILGGVLIQEQDLSSEAPETWEIVTEKQPTGEELQAMDFAWKAVKHVKSNAIIVATSNQTLGVGAGQMNRVGSVKIALEQAGNDLEHAALASDAFFPMDDSVEYAAKHGIKAIIQPGGSIKDQASIDMANRYGITMAFTGTRHFRH
ncbi:MAG: bifunctional phosphoribosylaminoimidazolecarboxamide formyltransferase/IMP cyclohydrolase [Enterococcus sp.]